MEVEQNMFDWDLKEESSKVECDFVCQCERLIYGLTTINYYEPYDG